MNKTIFAGILLVLMLSLSGCQLLQGTTLGNELVGKYFWGTISCDYINDVNTGNINADPAGIKLSAVNYAYTDSFVTTLTIPAHGNLFSDEKAYYFKICKTDDQSNCLNAGTRQYAGDGRGIYVTQPTIVTFQQIPYGYSLFFKLEDFKSSKCRISGSYTPTAALADDSCWEIWTDMKTATYMTSYKLYQLVDRNYLNGGTKTASENCANPKNWAEQKGLEIVVKTNLVNKNAYVEDIMVDRLAPGSYWNYISDIVMTMATVEDYNGQTAVCQNSYMYGLSDVKTISGTTYKVIDSGKDYGKVECCNAGDCNGINFACENHKCVDSSKATCSITKPCPYQDTWNVYTKDKTRKTIFSQECVDGQCLEKTKSVECTSNYECDSGYACVKYNCVITGADIGTSDTSTETNQPGDACKPILKLGTKTIIPNYDCLNDTEKTKFWASIIISFFVLIFTYSFAQKKLNEGKALSWVLTGIVTLAAYMLLQIWFWAGVVGAIIYGILWFIDRVSGTASKVKGLFK